jgi:hypothetical protein
MTERPTASTGKWHGGAMSSLITRQAEAALFHERNAITGIDRASSPHRIPGSKNNRESNSGGIVKFRPKLPD